MYTRKVLVRKEINEELGIGVGLSSDKQKKVSMNTETIRVKDLFLV